MMHLYCLIDKWSNSLSGIPVGVAAPAGASGILYWLAAETGQMSPPPDSDTVYCRPPTSYQEQASTDVSGMALVVTQHNKMFEMTIGTTFNSSKILNNAPR